MNRRTTIAGLGLAAVLTLAACGGGGDEDQVESTGSEVTTSQVAEPTPVASASGDAAELFEAIAAAQAEQQSVVATLSTDAAGLSLTGGGSMRLGDPIEADITLEMPLDASGQPQQLRVVIVDDSVYMQIPGLSDLVPGKSWFAATADGTDPFSQAMAPVLDQLSTSLDPSLQMYAHGAQVTESGTETVDGTQTTKYTGTVDLAAALADASGSMASSIQDLIDSGSNALDFSMWVDDESLLRKFEVVVNVLGQSAATTVTYSKWGEPVDIAAPPADQVADPSALGMG